MELQTMHAQLAERLGGRELVSATISQPRLKSNDVKRIKIKLIITALSIAIPLSIERLMETLA